MAPLRAVDPEETSGEHTPQVRKRAQPSGTWPHALSHEPLLRVSDVLRLVQTEFPTLSTSKLRFLDNHGLVSPHRTPSGYREYSPADVERLRFVLRQQRDHYRPLTVIAEHLAALDDGRMHEAIAPHAIDGPSDQYLSREEAARRAGLDVDIIEALESESLVNQVAPGRYRSDVVPTLVAAGAYLRAGGDVRALRTLRNAAGREVGYAETAAAPHRSRGRHGRGEAVAEELGEAAIAVFSAYIRHDLSR